jgi:hypothetical protein
VAGVAVAQERAANVAELTRRQLLLTGGALGAVAATGGFVAADAVMPGGLLNRGADEAPEEVRRAHRFVSRPDLRPPLVTVTVAAGGTEPGYVFLTPAAEMELPPPEGAQGGPLIVDDAGQPVWFAPTREIRIGEYTNMAADLKVQTFRGQPVLTWWRGDLTVPPGLASGEFVIADRSYREIATVRAGNGLHSDMHEFVLTPRDTALISAYRNVQYQGRPVYEAVVQELEIDTGRVLFEWNSLAHVPLEESFPPLPADPAKRYDYFHLNSIEEDADDTLLLSSRNTQTVYRISKRTGEVVWRLGGIASDFTAGPGAAFAVQHDARRMPDGTVSIFDNSVAQPGRSNSRALTVRIDEAGGRYELVRELVSPDGLWAAHQGNAQFMPGGNAFVSWGNQAAVTEFSRAGKVVWHATLGSGIDTYRGFRFAWDAEPAEPPAAAARADGDAMTVYASWNGATRVARWQVLTGASRGSLQLAGEADRTGFETAIPNIPRRPHVAVAALDRNGNELGRSEDVAP